MVKRIREEGQVMPPFYYGLAYRDWMYYKEIYFIMPLNYLVRWGRFIWHWWIKNIQHRESWFDKEVDKIRSQYRNAENEKIAQLSSEATKYRHAYYDCMKEIYKYAPKEVKERLFNLG